MSGYNRKRLRQHDRVEKFPPKVMAFRSRRRRTSLPLVDVLESWRPGSSDATGWDWDAEEADIRSRECVCCGVDGHYQAQLEAYMANRGLPRGNPPLLGDDGRVWDGHHRIVAARKLGWPRIAVAFGQTIGEGAE